MMKMSTAMTRIIQGETRFKKILKFSNIGMSILMRRRTARKMAVTEATVMRRNWPLASEVCYDMLKRSRMLSHVVLKDEVLRLLFAIVRNALSQFVCFNVQVSSLQCTLS